MQNILPLQIFYLVTNEALNDFSSNQIIDILRNMKMKFERNYDFSHLYMLNTKVNQYLIRFLKYMISHKELYLIIKEDVSRWNDGKHYKKSVLLWRFFCGRCKNHRYMSHIAAFFRTAVIGIVFCSILQRQDIKSLQYICFSSDNLDIAALQKPTTIHISSIEKNTAICEL